MTVEIGRRQFISTLGGATVAWPLVARAQQSAMPVIGVLYGVSAKEWARPMAGFHRGLGEMGFVEDRNVAIEYRWAEGQYDRMPAMADDLIGRRVAVILVGGSLPGVRAVMAATHTIPIVFTTNTDPVASGVVASLNQPGGNVTGVTGLGGELESKRLGLMYEMIPAATKFAVLVNPNNPVTTQAAIQGAQTAAPLLGLNIVVVNASTENEIETAFATAVQQQAAWLLADDAYFESQRDHIAALGLRHALPTILGSRESVVAGSLMNYGASIPDIYRQAGAYVGRILKGEKPANLPVVQPTKFELVINLKTAKTLGLTIPESFLARADEVIE
jgi:putative ABC transport system substrate-binding protein